MRPYFLIIFLSIICLWIIHNKPTYQIAGTYSGHFNTLDLYGKNISYPYILKLKRDSTYFLNYMSQILGDGVICRSDGRWSIRKDTLKLISRPHSIATTLERGAIFDTTFVFLIISNNELHLVLKSRLGFDDGFTLKKTSELVFSQEEERIKNSDLENEKRLREIIEIENRQIK